eukprot:GHVS01014633.1.p1 GENE.GHVS01014633.1~~GHVS01014633.1.p1  ORF type:complete len:343 (+),score=81.71 GHVS01014633.1:195-1223(+)
MILFCLRKYPKIFPPFSQLHLRLFSSSSYSQLASSSSPTVPSSPIARSAQPLILFQFRVCPKCNSIRALLDYCSIPYVPIEVNPLTRSQLIRHHAITSDDYWDVPILLVPSNKQYRQLNGVRAILDVLLQPPLCCGLSTETAQELDWLCTDMVTLIGVNVFRTLIEAREAIRYVHNISSFGRYQRLLIAALGPPIMRFVWAPHYLNRYRIKHSRNALFEAVQVWTNKIHQLEPQPSRLIRYTTGASSSGAASSSGSNGGSSSGGSSSGGGSSGGVDVGLYRGGDQPNICDIILFGQLRGLEGLRVMRELFFFYPDLYQWYCEMVHTVGHSSEVSKDSSDHDM